LGFDYMKVPLLKSNEKRAQSVAVRHFRQYLDEKQCMIIE
jgi:hypothetical protein